MIWETFYHIFNCFREPIGRTSRRVLSSSGVHFGTLFIIDLAPRSKYVIICKNINCPSGRMLLIHLCHTNIPIRTSWSGDIFSVGARSWLVLNAIEIFQEIMDFLFGHFWSKPQSNLVKKAVKGIHFLFRPPEPGLHPPKRPIFVVQSSRCKSPTLQRYLFACMYVCMHVCMYVCLSVCMSVCLSVCLSVCMSVCMHVCL